ncbi:cupin domain-containing protein [Herbaspirillum sp. alder98]|uniref:cupin domain-containing protein n=1 Tax=Herbaspirillum sp. alder98 TaxID=2913096 RepID=UPI001CD86F50|nr:cupin domain-containing protein [Herbaspirillum sp. alder98]MCA1323741.1 cupin domain-containing protein [Herbaspirillum sp. alder98]
MLPADTSPTVFSSEENESLSARSAEYSRGLNGAGEVNRFHHAKGRDLNWTQSGLRDFFLYADPGIREATGNRLDVHLVRANEAPEHGTGWHRHRLGFHAIYMVSGFARFMYEGKQTLVETGDFVNMPPGISHYLYDYSPDMCFLEIAMAGTEDGMIPEEDVEPFCDTPAPAPWTNGAKRPE